MTAAPALGVHTAEVLHAELGLSPDDLEKLSAAGIAG
jgi:hypothetical protein